MYPWPHVHEQGESRECAAMVDFLPPGRVQANCRDKFPTGCYIVHYRGGGMSTAIHPERTDLLARAIRAHAGDDAQFWLALGRDINAPYKIVDRKETMSSTKSKPTTKNISLEDIGL